MKVTKSGLIEHDGIEFSINSKWVDLIHEPNLFKKKFLINKSIINNSISSGVVVDRGDSVYIVSSRREYEGRPLLSAAFAGMKCAVVFSQVSADKFWFISFDHEGRMSQISENDTIKSKKALSDLIRRELSLIPKEHVGKFKIYNIGEPTDFSDDSISSRLQDKPFSDFGFTNEFLNSSVVGHQVGDLHKKIGFAAGVFLLSISLGAYYFVSTIPEDAKLIINGSASNQVTQKYLSSKKRFVDIKRREDATNSLSLSVVSKRGIEEYYDFIMSKRFSDESIMNHLNEIRRNAPYLQNGWLLSTINYENGRFLVSYTKSGEYPNSDPYTVLDLSLSDQLEKSGLSLTPVRLSNLGKVRDYEISFKADPNKDYSEFSKIKGEFLSKKRHLMSTLSDQQSEIDRLKSLIEGVESSVGDLSSLAMRDDAVIVGVRDKIDRISKDLEEQIEKFEMRMDDFIDLKPYEVPDIDNYILGSGFDGDIIPVLQGMSGFSWSGTTEGLGFPRTISDKDYGNLRYIKESVFDISLDLPHHFIEVVKPVYDLNTVFINSVTSIESTGKEDGPSLIINLSVYSINQELFL